MANFEQEYISSLQDFSRSVEHLVAAIKNQVESNKGDGGIKEVIKNTSMQTAQLVEIAENLEVVSENVKNTKNNTDEILKIVQTIKKEKKQGIFARLDKSDQNKSTAEGIKTIVLMAAGIMAIGAAFKLIGEVDFASVLALSVALPLVATAFNKVGETTKDPKEAGKIALSMIVMSAGITVSGYLLSIMPSLSLGQLITAIGVSASVGIGMYFLAKAADEIGISKIQNLYVISPAMPIVAAGILASSFILNQMPTLDIEKMFSALGVGIALGGAMIPIAMAAKMMKGTSIKDMAQMAIVMPLISAGIFASSFILNQMPDVDLDVVLSAMGVGVALGSAIIPIAFAAKMMKGTSVSDMAQMAIVMPLISAGILASAFILQNMPDVDVMTTINAGLAIAGATLPVAVTLWAMSKMGLGIKEAALGSLALTIISAGLMASSWILSVGNYENYPSLDWAQGVSLAMLGALPSVIGLGLLGATGIGFLVIGAGIAGMIMVAGGLVAVAEVLNGGDFTGGPTMEWSMAVGLALMTFANTLTALSPGIMSLFSGDTLQQRIDMIPKLGVALRNTSYSIQGGNYTGGPTKEWSQGVGTALMMFANTLDALEPGVLEMFMGDTLQQRINMIPMLGIALRNTSFTIQGGNYTGGPTKEWSQGVGIALMAFANTLDKLEPGLFDGDSLQQRIALIPTLGTALKLTSWALQGGNYDPKSAPTKGWAEGVGGSLVKFAAAMKDLDDDDTLYDRIQLIPHLGKALKKISWAIQGGNYDVKTAPSKKWAEGVGGSLIKFAKAMKDLDDDDTLYDRIQLIPHLGKALRDVSIRVSKGKYEVYPSKRWADGVGDSLIVVAKALKKMDIDDSIYQKIKILSHMGAAIRDISIRVNAGKYDIFPDKNWSKGILSFMSGVSKMQTSGNTLKMAKDIRILSQSYWKLASSISAVANSLNKIKKVPNLSNLYSGLIMLSVIDKNNLNLVLDTVKDKKEDFNTLLRIVNKHEEKADYGNDASKVGKNTNKGGTSVGGGGGAKKQVQTTPPVKSQPVVTKPDHSEKYLSEISSIASQLKSLLEEIADNTSSKLGTNNISH